VLATAAGVLLAAAGLREVFHQILHPGGAGRLTSALFRAVWRVARRLGAGPLALAGPVGVVASLATWALLVLVGFALVYWPHVPEGLQYAQGIEPARQGALVDALYVSGVTLATLGFGDVVAEPAGLRFAQVLEALVGFALLSAGLSWVLSIYPALLRHRSLAARVGLLLEGEGAQARLGPALVSLQQALSPSAGALPEEAATAAQAARRAIESLEVTLAAGPFGLGEGATVAHYSADHRG